MSILQSRRFLALRNGALVNGQIKFPATQNASADPNTLDDYEEGTWTPAFSATGGTYSYAAQNGLYTKIGRIVIWSFNLNLNTSGNTLGGNALSITGLPFAAGGGIFQPAPLNWLNSTTSYVAMMCFVASGASALTVRGLTAAGTNNITAINDSAALHATNGTVMYAAGTYPV